MREVFLTIMASLWHITLLGRLRVEDGEHVITRFRYQKAGALLAYLAYYLKQAHPREVLIDLFWPESALEAGRASLSTALSSLRNQLEPPGTPANAVLRADRFAVSLNPTAVSTDVQEFEEAIQQASRTSSTTERLQCLARAMERYQGRLLPGFYEDWIVPEQERLAGLYFDAAFTLVALLQEQGDLPSALRYGRLAVSVDPLREDAQERLMHLLVAAGQPGAALRQYRELERMLEEELGAEPSAPMRALVRQIEKQSGLSAPPLPSPSVVPTRPMGNAPPGVLSGVPTTVNLLLTDMEASAQGGERTGEAFQTALNTHHHLLRQAVAHHSGQEIQETGGSFVILFPSPFSALACAIAFQKALHGEDWPEETGRLKVRVALHTGDIEFSEGAYHGDALYRAMRLLTAAHGGQILVSEPTAGLLQGALKEGVRLVDLGVWRLRNAPTPERLYQAEYPGMEIDGFGTPAAEAGYQSHLPLRLTRFFGREQEITRISELLLAPENRLLTLMGAGGTGKTRLALEVADRLLEPFAGAVWFAPLADLNDPGLIASAIREAMRLPSSLGEPLEQVVEALKRQSSLLVLDNFEHLAEAGATIVQTLLERVPSLTLLVTSRQALGLSAEREFPVLPLPTPNGPDTPEQLSLYDSVRLFVDRAQAVKPDFQVSNHNAPAVAELCERLEGIPLAIELAAARAQVMTPAQMLAQLTNRFDFLTTGRRRDVNERHRTMRAAVEWSYRLLTPELQHFFSRLSVFRGGWKVEAAETVCEEPLALDYLAQLQDCSLVRTEDRGEAMRFGILETLREYAWEQLPGEERAAIRQRHLHFFRELAEEAERNFRGPEQALWFTILEAEQENFRLAMDWCGEEKERAESGLRLAGALVRFWQVRGHYTEGRAHLATALSNQGAEARTRWRSKALTGAGALARDQGDYPKARALHEESLSIKRETDDMRGIVNSLTNLGLVAQDQGDNTSARLLYEEALEVNQEVGNRSTEGMILSNLGNLVREQGDLAEAQRLYEASLAIQRELGDRWSIANLLNSLGIVAADRADYTVSSTLYEECLSILRDLGDRRRVALTLGNLGGNAYYQGDYALAHTMFEESLAIARDVGDKRNIAMLLGNLGHTAREQGDYVLAQSFLEESIALKVGMGAPLQMAEALEGFAFLASAQDEWERAVRLWSAGAVLRETARAPIPPNEREKYDREMAVTRAALGEEAFAAAWAEGSAMTIEQAVAYAMEENTD